MVYNISFLTKNQNIHVTKAIKLIFFKKKKVLIFKDIDKNVAFFITYSVCRLYFKDKANVKYILILFSIPKTLISKT